MKITTIKNWIAKNFNNLKAEYCLDTWTFKISVKDSCPEDAILNEQRKTTRGKTVAEVTDVLYSYERANIILYAKNLDNCKDLEVTLRHELWHCVLGGYLEIQDTWAEGIHLKHKKTYNRIVGQLSLVDELTVRHLEKIWEKRNNKI